MNTPQARISARFQLRPRTLSWTLANLALATMLGCPAVTQATPSLNFVSDVTEAHFDPLRIIYPDSDISRHHGDDDDFRHRHFRDDPLIIVNVENASDYYIVTNTVAAINAQGTVVGYSGWHTHPGPSVVLVKSGVATVYDGDDPTCTPKTYAAGSGFVDPGDGHVHMVRNEGTAVLVTQAFQIIPTGDARRIDAPSPGNCPF